MGLKPWCRSSELVDALRAEKMITVGAGDNVVRLLPPLIIDEAEIGEAMNRIDRACAALEGAGTEDRRWRMKSMASDISSTSTNSRPRTCAR